METIEFAAIKYRLKNEMETKYVTGYTHADCIKWFSCYGIYTRYRDMNIEMSGFMTDSGRFVDRTEAKQIALNAGQIDKNYTYSELYSEYLDWMVNDANRTVSNMWENS